MSEKRQHKFNTKLQTHLAGINFPRFRVPHVYRPPCGTPFRLPSPMRHPFSSTVPHAAPIFVSENGGNLFPPSVCCVCATSVCCVCVLCICCCDSNTNAEIYPRCEKYRYWHCRGYCCLHCLATSLSSPELILPNWKLMSEGISLVSCCSVVESEV